MSANWNKLKAGKYKQMLWNHFSVWRDVKQFIEEHSIESILEVGPGLYSPVRSRVKVYQGIDLNEKADAIHADFTAMDLTVLGAGRWDLLLACGVIEHCSGYRAFFDQVQRLNPRYYFISFFNGMAEDRRRHDRRGYPNNIYSKKKMCRNLRRRGWKYKYVRLSRRNQYIVGTL